MSIAETGGSDGGAFSTAVLYDAARRLGLEIGLNGVAPVGCGMRFAARAHTVGFLPVGQRPKSRLNFYDIISEAPIDHALVFGVGVKRWVFGGNLSLFAQKAGVAALVLDGCIRDSAEVRDRDYPVFSAGISVSGYGSERMIGDVGVDIACGGALVASGDLIVGDDDGAVCLPASRIDEIMFQAEEIDALDRKLAVDIADGRTLPELHATRAQWSVPRTAS